MTEPSSGSAKPNSGVYLWTSVGGDTHTPGCLETYYQATGAPGPEGLHTGRLLLGPGRNNESRADERLNKAKERGLRLSSSDPSPAAPERKFRLERKQREGGRIAGFLWQEPRAAGLCH